MFLSEYIVETTIFKSLATRIIIIIARGEYYKIEFYFTFAHIVWGYKYNFSTNRFFFEQNEA